MAALSQATARVVPFNWRQHSDRVLEFQYEVYQENFPGFRVDRLFLADYERQLRAALRNPYEAMWVVEEDGRAEGFLWAAIITTLVEEKLGYIKNVYISPERRGRGWGQLLVRRAEDWMRTMAVRKSALDVTCSNRAAVALYERCGYHVQRYRMERDLDTEEPREEARP